MLGPRVSCPEQRGGTIHRRGPRRNLRPTAQEGLGTRRDALDHRAAFDVLRASCAILRGPWSAFERRARCCGARLCTSEARWGGAALGAVLAPWSRSWPWCEVNHQRCGDAKTPQNPRPLHPHSPPPPFGPPKGGRNTTMEPRHQEGGPPRGTSPSSYRSTQARRALFPTVPSGTFSIV